MLPPTASAILEPVPRDLREQLRRAVVHQVLHEPRRAYPPSVHVGVPGAVSTAVELDRRVGRLDHALRTDVLEAMLRAVERPGTAPVVWLARCGPVQALDVDLAWLAAARGAAAELDRPLPMVVVTRRSWRDPSTGVGRSWSRLRAADARRAGHPGA
ncbi:hypothetical protein FE634_08935 [Nocardioides dongxiaopingii]|uniref:hypothetical protein n=1 Tax=Nocardioides TaxID=1839 RepID=UPI0010C76413|nr:MULTISPECIES: hypothetical protein [Nocardioides]QCW50506.1 hypothetical protein FE634_08935 [Nocardioides sp. S-1144]